jgi:site-specific DNA-methyltransferase (adenine-specific)
MKENKKIELSIDFTCEDIYQKMSKISDNSVNLILIDPPYGCLNIEWDKAPDFVKLFKEFFRIGKNNVAILIFSKQPYATDVINSCRKYFRYEIIWQKTQKTNFANAKKMPLCGHENILVFYKKLPTYNPLKYHNSDGIRKTRSKNKKNGFEYEGYSGGFKDNYEYKNKDGMQYPDSVITFSNWNGVLFGKHGHKNINPTQKPITLLRYLINTYSNENDTVFDGYSGSGSTSIACLTEKRKFIGCELDEKQYPLAIKRIEDYKQQLKLF